MTPAERSAYLSRPAPWWHEKTTSILPSEIPPWAQTILIVLLGLALFAAMVRW